MSKVQITAFTGEYHFLSNYCACPITIDGLTYRSAEAAFQAAKCNVPIDRAAFCTVPPNVAKAIGRKIKLRKGWEKERDGIMADVIHAKFSQNPALAQALIDTGDAELIEGNTWNDNYWGMCGCTRCRSEGTKGLNKLGKILMAERTRLQAATPAVTRRADDGTPWRHYQNERVHHPACGCRYFRFTVSRPFHRREKGRYGRRTLWAVL